MAPISISSVENAASYASAAVAPGEIVIVKGVDIGPSDLVTAQLDASASPADSREVVDAAEIATHAKPHGATTRNSVRPHGRGANSVSFQGPVPDGVLAKASQLLPSFSHCAGDDIMIQAS